MNNRYIPRLLLVISLWAFTGLTFAAEGSHSKKGDKVKEIILKQSFIKGSIRKAIEIPLIKHERYKVKKRGLPVKVDKKNFNNIGIIVNENK